jgi:hypothetical protein
LNNETNTSIVPDLDRPLWERQPGESTKAWAAFCTYRDLGKSRGIRGAAAAIGKAPRQLDTWSSKFGWVKRAAAFDSHHDRRRLESALDADCELHSRKLEEFRSQSEQLGKAQIALCAELLAIGQRELKRVKDSGQKLQLREICSFLWTAARIGVIGSNLVAESLGVDQILVAMADDDEDD